MQFFFSLPTSKQIICQFVFQEKRRALIPEPQREDVAEKLGIFQLVTLCSLFANA
jgi:hypothetical protein